VAKDGSKYIDYLKKDKERIKRDKEIQQLIRTDFEFPNFNIVFFAEEHIFNFASHEEAVNSEQVYALYELALKIENKPKRKELTYTERTLLSRA